MNAHRIGTCGRVIDGNVLWAIAIGIVYIKIGVIGIVIGRIGGIIVLTVAIPVGVIISIITIVVGP